MAATDIDIIWDQVNGTEAMIAVREAGYYVRCGRVLGMDNINSTPQSALVDAAVKSGKVPYNLPDPTLTGYVLRYVIIRGDSQNSGLIWAHYSQLNFSGSPIEKLAIEVGAAIEYEQMERLPETGEPFNVQLPDSDTPETTVTLGDYSTAVDNVSLQEVAVPRVSKVLSLYGLFSSVPANLEQLENCVNATAWPAPSPGTTALGLSTRDRGHWRAAAVRTRWSQRDGLYAVAITLDSKGTLPGEDWSTYKFAVDPTTGKKLSPSQALMDLLLAQDYEYGIRNNGGGVLKVGTYYTANFAAILNPILNNSPLRSESPFNALGA